MLLYVPFPSRKEAKAVSAALIKGRLIACSNIIQSSSMYCWKEKVVRTKEFIALMKTTKTNAKAAKKAILALHSHKIPCILELPARANREYGEWVLQSCR
ncbi:MAG TPA: divalent cation tolerance protein CutA [archaeon]|nr:divalent cation tolerance protein CutA [archaeon]